MSAGAGRVVLCLNSGSSSLKAACYRIGPGAEERLGTGAVERIGLDGGLLWLQEGAGPRRETPGRFPGHAVAAEALLDALAGSALPPPAAAGHRLVHGGAAFAAPTRIEGGTLDALHALVPLAPLHLPGALEAIAAVTHRHPRLPQVACFDTAFHRRMPERAQRLPLPREWWERGVRRYGFHGLSYEYVLGALGEAGRGRVIVAHLGNGASLAAAAGGEPRLTTMGLTPAGGVMMGTRTGDLDPGVLVYLMREHGLDAAALDDLINQHSGLLGVSGTSPDMRTLLERRAADPCAAEAVAMFCDAVRRAIGALAAELGGLDTLVFTGGIGERAAPVRAEICAGLGFLGVALNAAANARHADTVSAPGAACGVRVIPTNEDLMIARHTHRVVFGVLGGAEPQSDS